MTWKTTARTVWQTLTAKLSRRPTEPPAFYQSISGVKDWTQNTVYVYRITPPAFNATARPAGRQTRYLAKFNRADITASELREAFGPGVYRAFLYDWNRRRVVAHTTIDATTPEAKP